MMSKLDKLEKGEVKVTSDTPLRAIEAKAIATRAFIGKKEVLELILRQAKDGQYSLSLGLDCETMEQVTKDWNPTIVYLKDLNYRVDCEFFNRPYDPNIVTLNISWRE